MTKTFTCIFVIMALILLPSCSAREEKAGPTGTPEVKAVSTAKTAVVSTAKSVVNISDDMSVKFQAFDTSQLPQGAVPITKSPDNLAVYYMERTDKAGKTNDRTPVIQALKGDTHQKVNLIKLNTSSGKKSIVAEGIPFISCSKWNKQGNMIAFCGGERLTVYDSTKDKLLLADNLLNDSVTYFGWSPDGNSICTEHSNLINGTIYNFKDGKTLHCYETDISLYYKGVYGEDRYFASEALKIDGVEQKKSGGTIDENRTVVTDNAANILKVLPCGRFRDSYKNAVVQIGESGFGLQYYEDIDKPDFREITKEYVYDVKFTAGGCFIYTIKTDDVEKNTFMLGICDSKGSEMAKIPVSGPYVLLSADGMNGYVSGPLKEVINFKDLLNNAQAVADKQNSGIDSFYSSRNEEEKLLKTLRGAMDACLKFEMAGKKDYEAVDKYYIDSNNTLQMAHFDMTKIFDDRMSSSMSSDFYETDIFISKMSVKSDRASIVVNGICRNSEGAGAGIERALELIKKDGMWYVAGFSTFPDSKKAKDLKVKVEKIIKDMKAGTLFEGKFKGMEIEIGQIQFWQMSEPHLAGNVDYSNYCKVYLKVLDDGKEVVYKIVLSKAKSWAPDAPTTKGLSWL